MGDAIQAERGKSYEGAAGQPRLDRPPAKWPLRLQGRASGGIGLWRARPG